MVKNNQKYIIYIYYINNNNIIGVLGNPTNRYGNMILQIEEKKKGNETETLKKYEIDNKEKNTYTYWIVKITILNLLKETPSVKNETVT